MHSLSSFETHIWIQKWERKLHVLCITGVSIWGGEALFVTWLPTYTGTPIKLPNCNLCYLLVLVGERNTLRAVDGIRRQCTYLLRTLKAHRTPRIGYR